MRESSRTFVSDKRKSIVVFARHLVPCHRINGRKKRVAVDIHVHVRDFEAIRLRLGHGAWFKPDFAVLPKDDRLEFHETKGFWREAGRLRIKVAASTYPFKFIAIKRVKGNFIIWGDRTISLDAAWKFKHQRELMSHYENRLREGFDFVIFALNNPDTQAMLVSTLRAFFQPEFAKGAVRGATFDKAVSIKVDEDINTDLTRAAGDLFAEIKLRLADTVERFIIRVGRAGVFEQLGT